KGDFRGALEHFLASNRLVNNRNVIYNIARTYEQLHEAPNAYRYYTQALDAETEAKSRKRAEIEEALQRISPSVAVLRVESDPPGATVYIDRKDLGARGNTPRSLGLGGGTYRVIVELEGYEPAQSGPIVVRLGAKTPLVIKLKEIVSPVRLEGQPEGTTVRVDREDAPIACVMPCSLSIRPGHHVLHLTKEGFQSLESPIDVPEGAGITARPRLVAQTGNLVVNADVHDALIEIDGQATGFTPAVLSVPVGTHKVRISQEGFRAQEQTIVVARNAQTRVELQLAQVDEVNAASRSTESVEDAPSSVTVIPRAELRAMGYPTVAEAIRGVRGIYLSDDHQYVAAGFRGFSRSGDYGNRVLVLIDGQPTNDNYVGSSYIGYDARTDIDDIDRIEVVRGPGSVLYGTGAFFGVINLVTRSRTAPTHGEVALSTADYGVGRARGTAQIRLGTDGGVWTSVSAAHGSGRDFFFPGAVAAGPADVAGNARNLDSFNTATVSGRAWYKSLTVQWFFNSRKKTVPLSFDGSIFGDPRSHVADTRGLIEARFEPQINKNFQLLSRVHVNYYGFDGETANAVADGGALLETFRGSWAGFEQRAIISPIPAFKLTAGGELQRHLHAHQHSSDDSGTTLDRDDDFWVAAGYLVGDLTPAKALKVSLGSRVDYYSTFGTSVNPRAAVILKPYDRGNIKLLAGKAFRAPSVYELFYTAPGSRASVDLKPEQISSYEVEFTHRFSTTLTATAAGYANYVTGLVVIQGAGTPTDPNYYANSTSPILTTGGEVEVRRDWRQGWMMAATYSYQRSRYLRDQGLLREVPNAPEHLGSIRGAVPILGRTLMAMSRLSIEGPRYNRYDAVGDPPQGRTDGAAIWDLVLSGEAERLGVHYALGVYNLADYRYTVPLSREYSATQNTIVQSGRTVLASTEISF
ncbi:MAG: TonB-dependent receptor, partial [Polyangiaceae bacterium]